MADLNDLKADIVQLRDEARLQAHLAAKEVQDEWQELEEKWEEFAAHAELAKSSEGIKSALEALGEELKQAYERIRKSV